MKSARNARTDWPRRYPNRHAWRVYSSLGVSSRKKVFGFRQSIIQTSLRIPGVVRHPVDLAGALRHVRNLSGPARDAARGGRHRAFCRWYPRAGERLSYGEQQERVARPFPCSVRPGARTSQRSCRELPLTEQCRPGKYLDRRHRLQRALTARSGGAAGLCATAGHRPRRRTSCPCAADKYPSPSPWLRAPAAGCG